MRSSLLLVGLAALLAKVGASPTQINTIHEKREAPPPGWTKGARLDGSYVLPVRIALTQQNLDNGHDFLMDVSDPKSANFGKHWDAKKVAETFAPTQQTVMAVRGWLAGSGIAQDRVKQSQSLTWLQLNATVDEAERLLKTQYHVYEHASGQPHVACDSYSLPAAIQKHVDFITPTVHFDAKLLGGHEGNKLKSRDAAKSSIGHVVDPGEGSNVGAPGSGSLPKKGPQINIKKVSQNLEDCDTHITPDCLRALYHIPEGKTSNPKNSYGIVEYTPQSYLPSDLDLFFKNFSSSLVGKPPIFDSIDGGVLQDKDRGFQYNGESNLDLEYAMALVYPLNVTLYQVGDPIQSASFNNFLDALDGAYCTYDGGDDPNQDSSYPDNQPGGYNGPRNCGGFAATNVISTSYGYNEADLTPKYARRQCQEYLKLGLQGVTFLFSSGDYGVAGNGGQCLDPDTKFYNDGTDGLFNPSFPPTCPYVTAVGATQVPKGSSVFDKETACEQVIYSGGGFSNVFDLPAYQADAVGAWFADHPPPYGAERFNNSKTVRAYPDVAANGANYVVTVNGAFSLVYGTSASAPTFGAIVTLLNEERLAAGKGPVGFLNPTLYARPDALVDITEGGNRGCGTEGFEAVAGWDPVTGLGAPDYERLREVYLALP